MKRHAATVLLAVLCIALSASSRQVSHDESGQATDRRSQEPAGGTAGICQIDFGVTPDDFGNPNTCADVAGIPLNTQYVLTNGIVFGAAVDKPTPPTVILNDGACDPACRSAGVPEYDTDWWCQFRLGVGPGAPGPRAGVSFFSAELCSIQAPPGNVLMQALNNECQVIDEAVNTTTGTEILTVTSTAVDLISYVRVVASNPDRPFGVSVDCLSYDGPFFRDDSCQWDCGFPRDDAVSVVDLLALLGQWGGPGACDYDFSQSVDVVDLLKLLGQWGPCPCGSNSGPCFLPNGTPGCQDPDCCDLVCALDPFCCDVAWDGACSSSALEICATNAACPSDGSCFVPHGTIGCDQEACCNAVCAVDPFCCESSWDDLCVREAEVICVGGVDVCPGEGGCLVANGTPGCEDELCCNIVCTIDPFCCEDDWDTLCADEAAALCAAK